MEHPWPSIELGFEVPPDKRSGVGFGTMADMVAMIEAALGDREHLVGNRFSAADLYLGMGLYTGMGSAPSRSALPFSAMWRGCAPGRRRSAPRRSTRGSRASPRMTGRRPDPRSGISAHSGSRSSVGSEQGSEHRPDLNTDAALRSGQIAGPRARDQRLVRCLTLPASGGSVPHGNAA